MKKVIALILAGSLLFSTGCANMSRGEKLAVGATVAVAAIATILILGHNNKDRHHHHRRHERGCRCHECYH